MFVRVNGREFVGLRINLVLMCYTGDEADFMTSNKKVLNDSMFASESDVKRDLERRTVGHKVSYPLFVLVIKQCDGYSA